MNKPIETLDNLATASGLSLYIRGEAKVLMFENSGITIEITVPLDVLEWFVDASQSSSSAKLHWWCDYEGYDDTPRETLVDCMSSDIETIVGGLLEREIRLARQPASLISKLLRREARFQLDWKINGIWDDALP